jgi:2-methylcitrate dehydratase
LRDYAVDQGAFLSVAVACAIAGTQDFTREQAAHAISLALTTTMPLRCSRSGELSEWKGCATAHSVANAVAVARLAERGMQGPPHPFRGVDGFLQRIPVPLTLDRLGLVNDGKTVMERTAIKFLPVEWGAQALVEKFLEISKRIRADQITSIEIFGYEFLVKEIGGGRNDAKEKWDPQTRETADHSLPYLVARALVDGTMTLQSFEMDKVLDPALRPLMQKIKVQLLADVEKYGPTRQPVEVVVTFKNGQKIEETCEYALGHAMRPATRAHLDAKFMGLVEPVTGHDAAEKLLAQIRRLPAMADVSELTASLRAISKE